MLELGSSEKKNSLFFFDPIRSTRIVLENLSYRGPSVSVQSSTRKLEEEEKKMKDSERDQRRIGY
jgi:hypothetical protein